MEARGPAPNLNEAIGNFSNKANDLVAILSVSAKAYIPPLEIELAFDVTPDAFEHDYFQCFVNEDATMIVPNRTLDPALTGKLFEAILASPHRARLMRAIGQYSAALAHWKPGNEMMCVCHLGQTSNSNDHRFAFD